MGYGSHHYSGGIRDVELAGGGVRAPPPYPPPLKDSSWMPWLVPLFAVANIAVFAYSLYVNDCLDTRVDPDQDGCLFPALGRFAFEPLSVNPLLGPSSQTLDSLGALDYNKVVNEGEGWRLFTCIWLHAGVVHLVANMFSLIFVGFRLEQEFGFVKIGTLYSISGLGGSLVSCFSIRTNISVGASGALFGFLGAMLSELITNWTIYANKCAALMTLVLIIVINLAVSMVPHVDSSAHLGGFACGFLLGFVLLVRPQYGWISQKHIPPGYSMTCRKPKYKTYQYLLWITALVLLIIGFMIGFIRLYHEDPMVS